MKNIFIIVPILLCIFLSVGCTITKRRYMPGYHIEWKSSHVCKISIIHKRRLNIPSKIVAESKGISPSNFIQCPQSVKISTVLHINSTGPNRYLHQSTDYIVSNINSLNISHDSTYVKTYVSKPESSTPPLFGFLSILSSIIGLLGVTATFYALPTPGLTLLLPFGFSLLAFALAIWAIHTARKIRNNPWATVGVILAYIGILLGLIAITWTILYLI